jgi:heptaprenyl diphosphate synthase
MFALVQDEMKMVEDRLAEALYSQEEFLADVGSHLLQAGGKRLRPALYLLCSANGDVDAQKRISMAAAIELIHMATLVHDDVIDNASTRRGIPTANARWGNKVSILSGDFLFAKAFSLVAKYPESDSLQMLTDVICALCEGEIAQIQEYFKTQQTEADYLERIAKKTACFIAASCALGAISADMKLGEIQELYQFGYSVGMAFQITDDILDFTATSEQIGKPAGGDLRQGILTLPAIYALNHGDHQDELRQLIAEQELTAEKVERCLAIIRESAAMEYSYQRVEEFLDKAKQSLPPCLAAGVRDSLLEIAEFIGLRQF